MPLADLTHARSGTLSALANTPRPTHLDQLRRFLPDATISQQRAWQRELDVDG